MTRVLKIYAFFAVSAFVLGSLGYKIVQSLTPNDHVFGVLYRMFLYHESHPFQYIAVVAFTYAFIATGCALLWPRLFGWRQGSAIILLTVLVASVPGGILWKIHDMQAGFFTKGSRFWRDLLWGASAGLQVGWLVIALSVPYNIIGLIAGYGITRLGLRIAGTGAEQIALPEPPLPGSGSNPPIHRPLDSLPASGSGGGR